MKIRRYVPMIILLLFAFGATIAVADEGMWTFDNPPIKQLKEKYNFTPTQQWLDHIRLSSVRFNDGGSGSFVSPNGLVITNHHVALGQLQKISTAQKAAVFGGDPDNFTFPRHDLDFAFFRVYENGRPVQSKEYLKWNTNGAADGDLVFVSGHPGSTERGLTVAQLETDRDVIYPMRINRYKRELQALRAYSSRGTEQARQAADEIFGLENSLKAFTGEYNGMDKALFDKKGKEESDLRAKVAANADWQRQYASAWDDIATATKKQQDLSKLQQFRSISTASNLAGLARQ